MDFWSLGSPTSAPSTSYLGRRGFFSRIRSRLVLSSIALNSTTKTTSFLVFLTSIRIEFDRISIESGMAT